VITPFCGPWKSGTIPGCENTDACGTPTAFPGSVRAQRCAAFSVTRKRGSSAFVGGEKNGLRSLRPRSSSLVRSQTASSTGPALWGHAGLPGAGDPPRGVQGLRQSEAGEAGLAGGQAVLHQALRLLRGPSLPEHDDQGRGRGNPPGLEDGQGARRAVHEGATASSGDSRSQGDRGRRDIDPQRAHLPHRGQRLGTASADLVRGPGPLGRKHGCVLPVAGAEEEQADTAGGHGYVEAVSQLDAQGGARAPGRHPVRQVPHPAPPGRSFGQGAQGRVRPSDGQGPALRQGPEVTRCSLTGRT